MLRVLTGFERTLFLAEVKRQSRAVLADHRRSLAHEPSLPRKWHSLLLDPTIPLRFCPQTVCVLPWRGRDARWQTRQASTSDGRDLFPGHPVKHAVVMKDHRPSSETFDSQ